MDVTTPSIYQVSMLLSESIYICAIFMSICSLICTLSQYIADDVDGNESRHIIMSLFSRVCTFSHALVDDVDGDEVRCRWARSSDRECAGVCNAFPGAILDQVRT